MYPIVKVLFGSALYGTKTPSSDTDHKLVHVPDPRDILLHRTKRIVQWTTKDDLTRKNGAEDVDIESFSLHAFFDLLGKGEMIAIELLFASPECLLETTPEWEFVIAHRDKLISRSCKGFVSYCQRQAAKYGVRGSRVATMRATLTLLENLFEAGSGRDKLAIHAERLSEFAAATEHASIVEIEQANGTRLAHLEVCDRKLPFTISLVEARRIAKSVFDAYGARSLAAEQNQGVDWKAVAHALRVGGQAVELLSTGKITFPRPDAERLLAVKLGRCDYPPIQRELEELLANIVTVSETSALPENMDRACADMLVERIYGEHVSNYLRSTD